MHNALYRFNSEINLLLQNQEQIAQKEMPFIFTQTLQAEGCAIYLLDKGDYTLQHACSPVPFHHIFTQYTKDVPLRVQYFNDQDKITSELGQNSWTRALVLPLLGDATPVGLLFAYWTAGSPLDDLAEEIFELWEPIASQLAVIFYWRPLVKQLQQREKSLQALFQQVEQELEDNRKQIARELYFDVGQPLTSLMLQIKLLQESEDLEYVQGRLGGLKHIVSKTLEEVLHLSRSQRPMLLDKVGLPAALAAYVQEYREETKAHIQLNCPEFTNSLSEKLGTVVYRCVQEALTLENINLTKIAITINLSIKGDNLFLQILYNGYGLQEQDALSKELLRMEEKVRQAQGSFWVLNLNEQNLCLNILLFLS